MKEWKTPFLIFLDEPKKRIHLKKGSLFRQIYSQFRSSFGEKRRFFIYKKELYGIEAYAKLFNISKHKKKYNGQLDHALISGSIVVCKTVLNNFECDYISIIRSSALNVTFEKKLIKRRVGKKKHRHRFKNKKAQAFEKLKKTNNDKQRKKS